MSYHMWASLEAQLVKNLPAMQETPGSGRSPGEGIGYPNWGTHSIGYPLQYSWASLLAQTVKNLPAIQETPVQFLGQEEPLEKE